MEEIPVNFNKKISLWYELTKEIKPVVREKHKGLLEEIAAQVKEDFLMVDYEDEIK